MMAQKSGPGSWTTQVPVTHKGRCGMMVSAWWALAAFLLGIYGGIGLMALLYVVSKSSDEAEHLPDIAPTSW